MKQRLLVPVVAIGLAMMVLIPTTFASGEPGTTLYAQLGPNRFPAGQGAADASLTFNGERDIVLRIQILGPRGRSTPSTPSGSTSTARAPIRVSGSINRTPTAGPTGRS